MSIRTQFTFDKFVLLIYQNTGYLSFKLEIFGASSLNEICLYVPNKLVYGSLRMAVSGS